MRVFISWSGTRSRRIAKALRWWLPDVVNQMEPWMSEEDIRKGSHWPTAINSELERSEAGIICVTPENQSEPWLLFEAGALAKRFGQGTLVCGYLFGMKKADLKPGPLALYQATSADKEDTWNLISTLNDACQDNRVSGERLKRSFARCWPDLEVELSAIEVLSHGPAQSERSDREILEEILLLQRELARQGKQSSDTDRSIESIQQIRQSKQSSDAEKPIEQAQQIPQKVLGIKELTRLIDLVASKNSRIGAHLAASNLSLDGSVLIVKSGQSKLSRLLDETFAARNMTDAVAEVLGEGYSWRVESLSG